MNSVRKNIIGRAEMVSFPELDLRDIPARIDTGAKTSSVWASQIIEENGGIRVTFLDGTQAEARDVFFKHYTRRKVASSNGHIQERYVIQLLVVLDGRRIRARVNLADRSTQAYPVLIGRNVLRGKFIVDVAVGNPLIDKEHMRSQTIQQPVNQDGATA